MKEYIINFLSTLPYGIYFTNRFLQAGMIVFLSIVLAKLSLFLFTRYFEKITKKTKTKLDDLIIERIKKPLFYLILVYGLKLAILSLGFNGIARKTVNSFMAIVFVFILLRAFDVLISSWSTTFAKKTKSNIDDVLLPLFHKTARIIFVIITLMWLLSIWEINIAPYLAGVGISGIVLGLALQDSLKNVFGGITLVLDKTYIVGDKIKLDSGEIGTIYDIGLRSTKLVTYDNEMIYIPNGFLANSKVQNFTRPNSKLRVPILFGVEYGTDIDKVKKITLQTISKIEGIMSEPAPAIVFTEMGDFALKFKLTFWVEHWNDGYGKKVEVTEQLYLAFVKAKIGLAYPTQTIYVKK
ncbi:hypothetical protein COV12_00055 [Candidatus Woesearchaeota archaeon CG10_big_fil_rev_8_21_14_0_10_32_24]|nr:MAG: hypothetical protein COV12_00055 [Candidatus Woesearchaeota archaeon CG10_big_fil_rev_8_21_14_0_10_32_24]